MPARARGSTDPQARPDLWQLVEQTQGGNMDAYGELFRRTVGEVRAFLRSKIRDRDLVDDLVQGTYERMLKKIGRVVRTAASPVALLITIARNLIASHFRRPDQRVCTVTDELPDQPDDDADPSRAVILDAFRSEAALVLWASGVGKLPASERNVLRLRFLRELSAGEIADRSGRKATTVHRYQSRAVSRMKMDGSILAFAVRWSGRTPQ